MHKKLASCLACVVVLPACAGIAPASARDRGLEPDRAQTVTLHLGERSLTNESFWKPGEDQGSIGVTYDVCWKHGPVVGVGLEGSIFLSGDSHERRNGNDEYDVNTGTFELAVGPRVTFEFGDTGLRAYVGAGVAEIFATRGESGHGNDDLDDDDSDSSGGFYAHTGLNWRFARHYEIGLDYRILRGTSIELFSQDGDANYDQLSLTMGYSF